MADSFAIGGTSRTCWIYRTPLRISHQLAAFLRSITRQLRRRDSSQYAPTSQPRNRCRSRHTDSVVCSLLIAPLCTLYGGWRQCRHQPKGAGGISTEPPYLLMKAPANAVETRSVRRPAMAAPVGSSALVDMGLGPQGRRR